MEWCSLVRHPWFPLVLLMFIESCFRVGLVKAMGVLFGDISKSTGINSADLGITLGLFYAVGLFITPIVAWLYSRTTRIRLLLVVGAFVGSITIILASLSTINIHLAITFAVSGIGHAAVLITSMTALANLAGENFNLLYGISSCGFSVGMVLFPSVAEELLIAYDWRGVLLILGGFMLNAVPCALAIRVEPDNVAPDAVGPRRSALEDNVSNTESPEEASTSNGVSSCANAVTGSDHDDDAVKHVLLTPNDQEAVIVEEDRSSIADEHTDRRFDVTSILRRFLGWFRGTELYADPVCVFIFLSDMVLYFVYTGWHAFLIPHALQRGISQRMIILITFLAAVGNFSSRLTVSFFTHKLIDPVTMHLTLTLFSITSLACDACIPNFYVMLVTACCSAAAIAGRATLGPLVIRGRVSSGNVGMAFGIHNVLCGFGYFLGGYFTGLMEDRFSSYNASFKLLAAVDVMTFIFMLVPKLVRKPDRNSEEIVEE